MPFSEDRRAAGTRPNFEAWSLEPSEKGIQPPSHSQHQIEVRPTSR
jgi:hypothetical protein